MSRTARATPSTTTTSRCRRTTASTAAILCSGQRAGTRLKAATLGSLPEQPTAVPGGSAVHVEIWSDIACPWCYVGKRRFEAALESVEHRDEVQVTWRSFELDPAAPREREGDGATRLAEKYGTTRERALEMHQQMTDVAAA